MKKISIVVPCFNEKHTIEKIIQNILDSDIGSISKEIIIVDDNSNDGTREIIKEKIENLVSKVIYHNKNFGKGFAVKSGLDFVTGDVVIIQDADLEYDPKEYKKLLIPFLEADADIVYGSRFLGGGSYVRIHFFWHEIANKSLTFFCNIFTNLNLSDMETGCKAFKTSAIKSINIQEKSFGFEPEVTIKLAKSKFKFYEVSVSYKGRSYEEGKKIGFKDAVRALYCIIKYSLFS
jgi:glycosyltransferase involved in cell wall biosynthesis